MSKQMSEDCTRQTQKVLHYPLSYSGKDRILYIIQGVPFEKSRHGALKYLKIFEFLPKRKMDFIGFYRRAKN